MGGNNIGGPVIYPDPDSTGVGTFGHTTTKSSSVFSGGLRNARILSVHVSWESGATTNPEVVSIKQEGTNALVWSTKSIPAINFKRDTQHFFGPEGILIKGGFYVDLTVQSRLFSLTIAYEVF